MRPSAAGCTSQLPTNSRMKADSTREKVSCRAAASSTTFSSFTKVPLQKAGEGGRCQSGRGRAALLNHAFLSIICWRGAATDTPCATVQERYAGLSPHLNTRKAHLHVCTSCFCPESGHCRSMDDSTLWKTRGSES